MVTPRAAREAETKKTTSGVVEAASPEQAQIDRRLPDGRRSADIIAEEFHQSSALVTISRRRIVIARNQKEAKAQFAALISELKEIEERVPTMRNDKRLLSWVLDVGRRKKDESAAKGFELLQRVFRALSKEASEEARLWLAERATVFVANADLDWMKDSLLGTTCPEDTYGSSVHDASRFFATFEDEPWSRFAAFTAFRKAKQAGGEHSVDFHCYSHAAPAETDWKQGARGEERESRSRGRDEFMQLVYDASLHHISDEYSISESEAASKLFGAGFMMFAFKKFIDLR